MSVNRSYIINFTMNSQIFFQALKNANKSVCIKRIKHLLDTFGTSKQCNRFDIGNAIEQHITDLVTQKIGYASEPTHHAKRIDIIIQNDYHVSIKYSSVSDIKLHNSLGTNQDVSMEITLLVTLSEMWLLDPQEIQKVGINLSDYLKNNGDGLTLKRSILKCLKTANYPFFFPCDLNVRKNECQHEECWKLVYQQSLLAIPDE